MDNKVIITNYKSENEWDDGVRIHGQNITFGTGSYSVTEGEPEDMRFGRALEYVNSILDMVKYAHKLGKEGIELIIEEKDEE